MYSSEYDLANWISMQGRITLATVLAVPRGNATLTLALSLRERELE